MVDLNQSSDVSGHRDHTAGTSRPPLPRPDNGDNIHPVPLWEREFCRNAYNIPWETFRVNKLLIGLYNNVMDWEDSGALKTFEEAKERFRAKYHGEPFEDPLLDPDMYIDELDHHCNVDPGHMSSGTGRILIGGSSGTMWIGGASTGGAMKLNTGGSSSSGNCTVRNWNVGSGSGGGGGGGNDSGRNRNGGGGGGRNRNHGGGGGSGSGSGSCWNCFGCSNQRNHHERQHQQGNGGGIQRNPQQMRSGGRQQQGQGVRKMEWHPMQHNRARKDDPAA